ncbi:cytochrome P450 [Streptomyces sp. NBC_00654]|uniref:cytochrome P450 n=1 Tax=Streptomyces sp. NBC_00654 TaxID=2975799 RepID=UPI0022531B15|nr:cytochrome P450 [Streptomyces sp. NBC_00654]MCX4965536.1 cytochrome P450 [Streptomyces sp. NBC_00654]
MPVDGPERVPAAPSPRRRTGGQPGLLAPGAATDPCRLRLYRRLREAYPLCYDEGLGAWLLSRYADVAVALTDPRFAGYPHDGAPRGGPAPLGLCRGSIHCAARDEGTRGPGLQARPADPAGPAPPTGPTGSVHAVAPARRKAVERTAYVLARRIAGRQQADLVEEFCRWLPAGAAAAAAGLSSPDLDRLPRAALHPRLIHSAVGPTDCAGHTALRETALASFLANLLDDADLLAAVRTEPGLIARAWTETLRRDPPVQIVLRRTLTEVPVSGGTLPAGAPVACLTGAAGRDPDRFADPDLFDPFRPDPGRLITGPAGCPAVLLGRLEAEYGLRALLEAMPRLRWADGFRPVGTGLLTRGPRTLLVRPS